MHASHSLGWDQMILGFAKFTVHLKKKLAVKIKGLVVQKVVLCQLGGRGGGGG